MDAGQVLSFQVMGESGSMVVNSATRSILRINRIEGNVTEGISGYTTNKQNFTSGFNMLNDFKYNGDKGSFLAAKLISPASNGIAILQSGVYRVMMVATVRNTVNLKR